MLQKVVKDRFAYAYAWKDNGFPSVLRIVC